MLYIVYRITIERPRSTILAGGSPGSSLIIYSIIIYVRVGRYTLLAEPRYVAPVVAAVPWVTAWRNPRIILRLIVGVQACEREGLQVYG
ncbi:MAG: hypothetical protein GSR85_11350 [Desulfurococcales archaeon]|nr:hypothetical protein [Desulfurococcales archaeon]